MANIIYSRVTINPEEAFDYIYNIIENMPNVDYGQETKLIVETFYTEDELKAPYNEGQTEYPITESGVMHGWLYDNVGSKWLMLGLEDDIRIESANYTPEGFLIKMYKMCTEKFEDVELKCQWWDENETHCGVAVIKNNIITQDENFLDSDGMFDPAYNIEGDEDIESVKEYLKESDSNGYLDLDVMDEDEIRDVFSDWKNEEKWEAISDGWLNMYSSCEEAIDTEDFEFPITSVKSIQEKTIS